MKQNQDPKRYINKTDITYTTKQAISKQCKAYGYLDGYYDEVIYEEYIGLTDVNKNNYAKGYVKGVNERLEKTKEELKREKQEFIKALAINDGKKSIPERKVSGPYKDLYLYEYYQEMFSTFSSLEKYMYDTEPIKNNEKSLKEQSYVFGYLDGLHNEITYSQNEDINYNMYELGYETGTNQRKKDDPKQNLNKLKWITFLAINDIKNNIEGRVFNPSTMDIYDTVCEEILIENEQTIQSQNLTEQELMQNHYKKQIKRVKNLDK